MVFLYYTIEINHELYISQASTNKNLLSWTWNENLSGLRSDAMSLNLLTGWFLIVYISYKLFALLL
jgi:hypothetical protein